jgi:tRNA pseudouridine55 synthase
MSQDNIDWTKFSRGPVSDQMWKAFHTLIYESHIYVKYKAEAAIPLDRLPDDADLMARAILPLQAGLGEIPIVPVDRSAAATLRRGQKLLLRGQAPTQGRAYVECFGTPIAFGVVEDGYFVSTRVFNLRG